jgi:capsular polysaccharide export protein
MGRSETFHPMVSPYRWAEGALSLAGSRHGHAPSLATSDIVFASDEKFLAYTAVALASVLETYACTRPLRVFLLTDRPMSAFHRERYAALQAIRPFTFREIVIDGCQFRDLRTTPGISVVTFFRLHMHLVLPSDCHRVVYLDSDVLVRRCISKLLDADLGQAVMAGVEDSISRLYVARLGQHPDTRHVNAGVLVTDIDALRSLNFEDLVRDYIMAKRYVMLLGDQQIITSILGLVTRYLPIEWNVHGSMFEGDWAKGAVSVNNDMDWTECRRAIADPAIVHYTYKRKPWLSLEHPRAKDWHRSLKRTAYVDMVSVSS